MDAGRPLRKSGLISQKIGDECMLYDPAKGSMHVINGTAEFVLNLCDGTRSLNEIEQQVLEAHQVPEGIHIRRHLENILHNFTELGIIQTQVP
ncbi:MAG: HPr-rel-A system PqqD family peptide chaperone [Nitrospiraceae bacterium]|nr:MAG: HPr-rel-A system PqqD family peptide chaperone [Nitrospiraceae bacterium]